MGDDLGLRPSEVFPALSGHIDTWKPLLKAVRANSLVELSRRVRNLPFSEDVCGMHFPLKPVPDDPEHEELPCTEWFAFKPSGSARSMQTDAYMPILFAAVHNVYRWGHGYGIQDTSNPAAKQSRQSIEILDFILRHGGAPTSSCFLGLELDVRDVSIINEPSDSPLPTNETQRARWCEQTTEAFKHYFHTHRLSPLRRHIRVISGDYSGRMLVEAYGDLAMGDELQWETTLSNHVEVRVTAVITDWHFAPVVACDVETKENYLYIPIGGERAPRDYAIMLKEYAARMSMDRACEALDVVIERFANWNGVEQRAPEMVMVPASMQNLFQDLYSDHSTADVVLEAEGRSLPAHRLVLSGASPYFRALLMGPFLEGNAPRVVMECEYDILESTIQFIYTGKQDTLITVDPLRVLPVAHKYGLDALQHVCEINAKAGLTITNLGACLRIGHLHGSGILRDACLAFIGKNPFKCMLRPEITSLRTEDPELWIKLIVNFGADDGTNTFSCPNYGSAPVTYGNQSSFSTLGNDRSFADTDSTRDMSVDGSELDVLPTKNDKDGAPSAPEVEKRDKDEAEKGVDGSGSSVDAAKIEELESASASEGIESTRPTLDSQTPGGTKRAIDAISSATDIGGDTSMRWLKRARRTDDQEGATCPRREDDTYRHEENCAIM